MQISNFISKMLELLENKEAAGTTSSSNAKGNKLFTVDYSNDSLKYLENSSLSYEKLQELALKEELKSLSAQMTAELTKMVASGKVTPEKYEEIEDILSGGINADSIQELQKVVSELEEPKTQETYTGAKDIEEKLGDLGEKTRESLMKKVGDINSVKSLEILDNGSFKLTTIDDSTLLTSEGGAIVQTYDNEFKTGFDVYDEKDRLKSSTYVDHKKDDTTVVEKFEHNEDGSYKETIDTSADPKTQKIVSVDENSNITNVEIKNKETGEVTQDQEFSQTLNQNTTDNSANMTMGAMGSTGGATNGDIAADEAQLAQLQQEQSETQQDLTCQQATYDQTNAQKEQEVGALDTQIATEQSNLDSANEDQTTAQGEVDEATGVCEQAQAGVDTAQGEVDSTQTALDEATNDTNEAQGAQQTAASNQAAAVSEEQAAQNDSTAANNDLSCATQATNDASCEKQATGADLSCAVGKTNSAFNVKTQKDQAVKNAERAYKQAEAQKNQKKKNLIDYVCDAWNWVCEQCSKAWNALTNAKDEQKEALDDYKNKKTDEDKKRVIDEKAQNELEKRQDEQDRAKSVADAAQVVLDAKTGAREVSDQELADALLDLADAMMVQDGAATEHDGALNAFMEAQGYKADADGNLVDKQGNLVSCQEIVKGLETFVGELSTQKTTTEASYNQVLETTTAVIQGDEQKIQQLGTEIQTLQEDITQKKAELALQEEMMTQLTSERSDVNAYGTPEAEEKYWSDRKKLEEAIMSGDPKALEEAYKALYGDKEVVVDASGKVVDPSTLSEEERAKCTTKKISEISGANLTDKVAMDKTAAGESAQMAEFLADGAFAVNGQPISQEELNEALIKQAEEQIAELERTMDAQGLFSKGVGGLNNVLGIGTTGEDAKFEVQRYKELVEQLKTCTNPTQYAALYKQVTGNNFSANEVVDLAAYRKANNMASVPTSSKAPQVPAQNKIDLGEYVDTRLEACKGEDGKTNTSALKKTGNSKGAEAINDYKETQKSIVEGAKGVLVGLAAVAAVAASPFTGGGSLALLAGAVAVGAAAGAGASVAIGMFDSAYDADGDGSIDFNYTLDDLKSDAITGSITGGVSALTMGVGDKVCGALTSKASGAIATTGKEAFKQTAVKFGSKVCGEAVEGMIDGSVSAAAEYTYRTAGTGEFSVEGLLKSAGQGGAMGGVIGGGMGAAGEMFSGTKHLIDGKIMQGKVDDVLTMGGMKEVIDLDDGTSVINYKANPNAGTDLIPTNGLAEVPNLKLEDVIANNLDPKYIVDGKVNKWAISDITQNAKQAEKALKQAGLGDNALNVLNNVSTDNYAHVADVTSLLSNKGNMQALGLSGADGNLDVDKASNFLSGLDEVKTRANGTIEEITSYAPNGQKVSLQFDEKGSIADVKIVDDVNAGASDSDNIFISGNTDIDANNSPVAQDDIDISNDTDAKVDIDDSYKDDYVVISDGDVIDADGNIISGSGENVGPKVDTETDIIHDAQNKWPDMSIEEKTEFVKELKNPDGTPRFSDPGDIEEVAYIMHDSPVETAILLDMKNPDGSYRFNAFQIDVISQKMEKYPDEVIKLLDLKSVDGSPRLNAHATVELADTMSKYPDELDSLLNMKNPDGSYMFNAKVFSEVQDIKTRAKNIAYAHSGLNNPPLDYTMNDLVPKIKKLKKAGYLTADINVKAIARNPGMLDNEMLLDINKMYNAMQKGISVEDAFAPKYADVATAAKNLNTGDVCRIGSSDRIAIKLSDGTIEELNMSYEKYLELFPPISEYVSQQQNIGDCYLVSSIDQLYKTPETKANVLRSFTENLDGSLTIKLPNGKTSFTIAAGAKVDDYVIKEMRTSNGGTKKGNFIMNASEGYKALEYTYGLELVQQNADSISWRLQYDTSLTPEDAAILTQALLNYSDPNFVHSFATQLRDKGGWKSDVFNMFGFQTRGVENYSNVETILTDSENWGEYIIGGGTKGTSDTTFLNENLQLAACHAYSIEPFVADELGNVMYKVTNPWHGTNNIILTLEELEEYFDQFYVARKP